MSQTDYPMRPQTIAALEEIAARHGFTLEAIRAPGKFKTLCDARKDCYRYLYDTGRWSTPQIGKFFNRDHTTVLWWLDGRTEERRERLRVKYQQRKGASR